MRYSWLVVAFVSVLLVSGPAAAQPDLEIGLLWATEENDIVNDQCITQVHYILQIFNAGTEDAGPFKMHVVIDSQELPAIEDLDQYMGISHYVESGIKSMDMYQIELWWKEDGGLPPGYWKSWMLLDLDNEVEEFNEDNNTDGPIFVETNPPTCEPANVLIETFTAELVEGVLKYTVVVASESAQVFPEPVRLDLYHHRDKEPGYYQPGDQTVMLDALGLGETYKWETEWTLPEPEGVFQSYVIVDGDNILFETSEADNIVNVTTVLCSDCPLCADGEPVNEPCECGGLLVADGFCCEDVHQFTKCFYAAEVTEAAEIEPEEDIVAEVTAEVAGEEIFAPDQGKTDLPGNDDDVAVVEDDLTQPQAKKSKGCNSGPAGSFPGWLLLLVGLLAVWRWLSVDQHVKQVR
jgi:hypothetical protein